MASDSPPTPPPPSNNIGLGKSSPNMKALNRVNVDFARSTKELSGLMVQEALLRHDFKRAKAAVQDVNIQIQRALEKKAEYTSMRVVMRGVVEKEKAQQNERNSYSLAPRNLSGASARGSVTHAAKVPAMILINEVPQKSVGDTSIGEDEEITKETSV